MNYLDEVIDQKILNINTAFLAKVLKIEGKMARVQPLSMYKAVGGASKKKSPVSAVIPRNIKYKEETITYKIPIKNGKETETTTVLVPDSLAIGDIVYVGVCDRDISFAKDGIISEATNRHHDVNDGVILRVL